MNTPSWIKRIQFRVRRRFQLATKGPTPQEQGKVWTPGDKAHPAKEPTGHLACPNCHGEEFLEGPSGGLNTNVECVTCALRWNSTATTGISWDFLGFGPPYNPLRAAVNVVRRNAGVGV